MRSLLIGEYLEDRVEHLSVFHEFGRRYAGANGYLGY